MRSICALPSSLAHVPRTGSDPFGAATMQRPWEDGSDSVENAIRRARGGVELIEKLGGALLCVSRPRRGAGGEDIGRIEQDWMRS